MTQLKFKFNGKQFSLYIGEEEVELAILPEGKDPGYDHQWKVLWRESK